MNVVPIDANAWRAFPHVITKGTRTNRRWRIRIRRNGPPAEDVYSYAGPELLDSADRLTPAGQELIIRDITKRARKSNAQFCVVWSKRSCTWFDRDGTPRDPPCRWVRRRYAVDINTAIPATARLVAVHKNEGARCQRSTTSLSRGMEDAV